MDGLPEIPGRNRHHAIGMRRHHCLVVALRPHRPDGCPDVQRGQLWRLFTSIFLHVDILHLLFNLYWFWMFGTLLERTFGHARTAFIVILLAIGSSAFAFAFDRGGVGLSGVGYGLFGMLWVLSRYDHRFRATIGPNITTLFVAWFFLCILATAAKIYAVANVAHLAGALLGALLGYAIAVPGWRLRMAIALSAVVAAGIWGATLGRAIVNVSRSAAYDESKLGYDALLRNDNVAAQRWLNDAARLEPRSAYIWYDLGIAHARHGDLAALRPHTRRRTTWTRSIRTTPRRSPQLSRYGAGFVLNY